MYFLQDKHLQEQLTDDNEEESPQEKFYEQAGWEMAKYRWKTFMEGVKCMQKTIQGVQQSRTEEKITI